MNDAHRARGRLLLAFNILLALLIMLWLMQRLHPSLATDVRRDLLLDAEHVELLDGFDGAERLGIWNEIALFNPDRDEVALPVRRQASLAWHVGARHGRFLAGAARLVAGPEGDDSEAVLIVRSAADGGPRVEVALPPAPAAPDAPAGVWREGPAAPVVLDLPDGSDTLLLETSAPGGAPDGAAVALLSPRVIQEPAARSRQGWPVDIPEETHLLARVPDAERNQLLAWRRPAAGPDGAEPEWIKDVFVAPVEAVGSFSGADERPAIAFTGDQATAEFTVDIEATTSLRGALAMDERMPTDHTALFVALVDDEVVFTQRVEGTSWREIDIPLGTHAGAGRRLSLRLSEPVQPAGEVTLTEVDWVTGASREMTYSPQLVRFGCANPRLVTRRQVQRRVASAARPSVIVFQVETLRADALPIHGGLPADLAPNLSSLAQRGIVFEQAMTPSPWTVPTTASLMTGLPPSAHGATDHDRMVLPGGVPTLAESARAAGVATGAVVASEILRPHAGFARGFESFAHIPYANARQVDDLAEAFLSNHVGQQFLLFVHAFDPHSPYNAPGSYRDRYVEPALAGRDVHGAEMRIVDALRRGATPRTDDPDVRFLHQRYLGEIAWLDEQVGRLLAVVKRLGIEHDTIVVFTSDHGEEFLEHGLLGHGSNLHDETLHVPLIVAPPGDVALAWPLGARVDGITETIGLHASVLDWLGVDVDRDAVRPPLERPAGFAFSETDKGVAYDGRGDPLRRHVASVRTASGRFIQFDPVEGEEGNGCREFYDLAADPRARHPLRPGSAGAGQDGRRAGALLGEALQWAASHRARSPLPGAGQATIERLKQLGYIDMGVATLPDADVHGQPAEDGSGEFAGCGPRPAPEDR